MSRIETYMGYGEGGGSFQYLVFVNNPSGWVPNTFSASSSQLY